MSVTSVEVVGTQLHERAAAMAYLELQARPYALSDPVRIHGDMEAIGVPGAECAARSGLTARRAEALGIVTRQGQDPVGGLVSVGDRARAAPRQRPQWPANAAAAPLAEPCLQTPVKSPARIVATHDGPGGTLAIAKAGRGRVARLVRLAARGTRNPLAVAGPPVPCRPRLTDVAASRVAPGAAGRPRRPLTRLRRRTTTSSNPADEMPEVAWARITHALANGKTEEVAAAVSAG